MKKTSILSYRPSYIRKYGIGYAATVLAIEMNSELVNSDIFSIQSEYAGESTHVIEAFSKFKYKFLTKLFSNKTISKLSDILFIKRMSRYDVAYLWPGCPIEVFKELKKRNKLIITECVNCHQSVAKEILDNESKLLGGIKTHIISNEDIENEIEKLQLADFIFSPSPQVTSSLITMQVEKNKILESSYGLDKSDLIETENQFTDKKSSKDFTAIFVGSVIPRKGVHLLLDYWKSASIKGRLKVIGKIGPELELLINSYKQDTSIEFVSFTNDLASHYQEADLFIMPSIEEGSPLVTYLAMGCGLACLVSPMAAGGIVQDNKDGYILPPHDKESWVSLLKKLATDKHLQKKLGFSSRQRAEEFLWPKVAQRRATLVLDKMDKLK